MAVRSFRHKGLADLWAKDARKGVRTDLVKRVVRCLQLLHAASTLDDLQAVPSLRLHALHGKPQRWAIAVNGPWRITFAWQEGDAQLVDLEQYH